MSTKVRNPFAVRWARFDDGERMPFLVSTSTGLPLETPTYWVVAKRRLDNVQPNTIQNELRCLSFLYLWAHFRGIDVLARIQGGVFFSLSEIVDLTNFCGRFSQDILAEREDGEAKIVNLGRRREARSRSVVSDEKRNRLVTIYSFVEFTSADFLSSLSHWPERLETYNIARNLCLELLRGYIKGLKTPRHTEKDEGSAPLGLTAGVLKRLMEVIHPDHPENPFSPKVRFRNFVMIWLFYELGLRRGELLGAKVADLSTGTKGTIHIHRRPDDPEDKRKDKPASKTTARKLPLSPRAVELLHEWVAHHRRFVPGATTEHNYLFVEMRDGRAMSLSNLNKMFAALRSRVPGLSVKLHPHIMRHTWNDTFSKLMDKKGIGENEEKQFRARLMGWRQEASARFYLHRTVQTRSDALLREMQDNLSIGEGK